MPSLYRGRRFPVEIIDHCAWLYHRFPPSLRDVQEMMMVGGAVVSQETVHQWSRKFGQGFADGLRRRRVRPGAKWHVDETKHFALPGGAQRFLSAFRGNHRTCGPAATDSPLPATGTR